MDPITLHLLPNHPMEVSIKVSTKWEIARDLKLRKIEMKTQKDRNGKLER